MTQTKDECSQKSSIVVAQFGARMHYAVPRILAQANMLECLYTDTYAPRALRSILAAASRISPGPFRRWLGRIPSGIPEAKIVSFDKMGLEFYWRRRFAWPSATAAHLWGVQEFCRRIIDRGMGNASCVYTYSSEGLELLQFARAHGIFTIMEQTIASGIIERKLMTAELVDYPQWAPSRASNSFPDTFIDREQMEWEAADLILCCSEFVRNGIKASGGPTDRCYVVPYGIRPPEQVAVKNSCHKPLRVLTVGDVGLRKGTPYVLETARSLKGQAEFRMAGHLNITPYARRLLGSHVSLLGEVPRSEIHQQFQWADVFLLPSICEGSATACYEALAYGLPVITTANAGSVVRDGLDGFIVPIRDSVAIIDRLERFANNGDMFTAMSKSALARASEYTLEQYGRRLLEVFENFQMVRC